LCTFTFDKQDIKREQVQLILLLFSSWRRYKKVRAEGIADGQEDVRGRDVSAVGEAGYERAMVRPHDDRRRDQ
jgi:hypothetical protein